MPITMGTGVSVVQGTAGVVDKTLRQSVSAGYRRATGVTMATRVHSTTLRPGLRGGRASAGPCCVTAPSEAPTHDDTGEPSHKAAGMPVSAVVGIKWIPLLMPIHSGGRNITPSATNAVGYQDPVWNQ
jgi:hypothetical protein